MIMSKIMIGYSLLAIHQIFRSVEILNGVPAALNCKVDDHIFI